MGRMRTKSVVLMAGMLWYFGCAGSAVAQTQGAPPGKSEKPPATEKTPVPGIFNTPLLQKRISLSLKDADINKAVAELSKSAEISLVVERPANLAKKLVTLEIANSRLRDVMDLLAQSYGYRWRRRNEVFLLTMVPNSDRGDQEMSDEDMKQVPSQIFNELLTPEQQSLVKRNGFIDGKDLTPGQQGIVLGFLNQIMLQMQSRTMTVGRIDIDLEKNIFGISGKPADSSTNSP